MRALATRASTGGLGRSAFANREQESAPPLCLCGGGGAARIGPTAVQFMKQIAQLQRATITFFSNSIFCCLVFRVSACASRLRALSPPALPGTRHNLAVRDGGVVKC